MSNDMKFWVARLVVLCCIVLDVAVLFKMAGKAMERWGGQGGPSLVPWIALFFVVSAAGMAAGVFYYQFKARRFDSSQTEADKIAVETLARLGSRKDNAGNARNR